MMWIVNDNEIYPKTTNVETVQQDYTELEEDVAQWLCDMRELVDHMGG